jgi:uncharacterized protein (TIGR03067 family)
MIRILLAAALVSIGLALSSPGDDRQPSAKGILEGDWKLQSVEINAQPLSMEKLQDARLTVRGAQYSLKLADAHLAMSHKLLPAEQPPAMDLTVVEGPEKGKAYAAIYKLDGEKLTVCRSIHPGQPRPTEFATQADSGLMLVVWVRQPVK